MFVGNYLSQRLKMSMQATALTSAGTLQIINSFPLFDLLLEAIIQKLRMSYMVTLSYKRGHRKFRSDGRFLEKNHDILKVARDINPQAALLRSNQFL